ncbi:MAG: hypothetical protein M5R40_07220 [Anaerolineae bacterium]|nr:hypothetical protein [Anaerolineae bacterium]
MSGLRLLCSAVIGLGAFIGTWVLGMVVLTGERYVSVVVITPIAALIGVVVGIVAFTALEIATAAKSAPAPRQEAKASPAPQPARREGVGPWTI